MQNLNHQRRPDPPFLNTIPEDQSDGCSVHTSSVHNASTGGRQPPEASTVAAASSPQSLSHLLALRQQQQLQVSGGTGPPSISSSVNSSTGAIDSVSGKRQALSDRHAVILGGGDTEEYDASVSPGSVLADTGGGGPAAGTTATRIPHPDKRVTTICGKLFIWTRRNLYVAVGSLLLIVGVLSAIVAVVVVASNNGETNVDTANNIDKTNDPTKPPILESITILLNETNGGDLTVWDDPSSAAYKARDWIVYNDTLRDEIIQQGVGRLRQRYTLALLYYATGGDTWSINETMKSTTYKAPTNNTTEIDFLNPHTSECTWTGVTCGQLDTEGQRRHRRLTENNDNNSSEANSHIFRLDFRGTNLTGSIPTELGIYVPTIKELDLSANELSGTLSSSLFDKGWKTTLYWLDLSDNQLSGTIPPSLWSVDKLRRLFLNGNRFTGPIRRLEDDPSYNQTNNALTGEGATRQGNFLIQVFINENSLTGSLPAWFTELRDLEEWIAFKNDISGPLPDPPAKLGWWDMSTNRLTGTIPESLWSLPTSPQNLYFLYLDNNQLSGPLPPASQPRLKLQKLWLQENALTGTIPSGFGLEWDDLEEIKIQGNELTGILGPVVSNVTYLDAICLETWPRRLSFEAECLELETTDNPPVQCDCCTMCM